MTFSRIAMAGVSLVLTISMDVMMTEKKLERREIKDLVRGGESVPAYIASYGKD